MQAQKTAGSAVDELEAQAEETEESPKISLDALLDETRVAEDEHPRPMPDVAIGIRTARLVGVTGRKATIAFRGEPTPIAAEIAPEVEPEVVSDACANGDSVLVELTRGMAPLVVGVLQTRRPKELHLRAAKVHIEGEEEVVLRSGRGALRIREDGDIEVVGSRISAASRGLFRIVGRLLRLN